MTLDEAQETITSIIHAHASARTPKAIRAMQLGIEALKAVQKLRHYPFPDEILHLPGEAEE
ncbi:hypothetical protein ES703_83620 [subsurface metagenome]